MIVMLISDADETERKAILFHAKNKAAMYSDEKWAWIQCRSPEEVESCVKAREHFDLACVDLTMPQVLACLPEIRRICPDVYLILVADSGISPLVYMKPSIHAESLLLKPLTENELSSTMDEAVSAYAARFADPDEEKVFVAESKGSRTLIEFDRIRYFEAREKKVFANTGRNEFGFSDTIDRLSEKLEDTFLRVHRSFLVNRSKIRQVFLSQNLVILTDGTEVPLSRSYKPAIRNYLEGRREYEQTGKDLDSVL